MRRHRSKKAVTPKRAAPQEEYDYFTDIGSREDRQAELPELEEGLKIDKDLLDDEVAQHSEIYYRVAKYVGVLCSRRDELDKLKKEAEAQADAEIRRAALKSEERITERQVESEKAQDQTVRNLDIQILRIKEEIHLWGALKEAYEQRNFMLSRMVEMYTKQYYERIMESGGSSKMRDAHAHEARHGMAEQRKKRRRL